MQKKQGVQMYLNDDDLVIISFALISLQTVFEDASSPQKDKLIDTLKLARQNKQDDKSLEQVSRDLIGEINRIVY
jgi:hypothetical protein